jgi:hypothetical protein
MIDLSTNIVLHSSDRNRIHPTSRHRGVHSCLRRAAAWVGALVGKVTFLPTSEAPPFTLYWVVRGLSPLNILIPSSRSLGGIGAWHRLTLRSRIPLSSYLGFGWNSGGAGWNTSPAEGVVRHGLELLSG